MNDHQFTLIQHKDLENTYHILYIRDIQKEHLERKNQKRREMKRLRSYKKISQIMKYHY